MEPIRMVDLRRQYETIKVEIDQAIQEVLETSSFINGPVVREFAAALSRYLDVPYVIPCGNGTDALQAALMALELQPGDEVIVPDFTFIATAEVVAFLGLTPVLVDVDPQTFMITPEGVQQALTSKTRAIIPVHLYGQCAPMQELLELAARHHLYIIEDNAQALGSDYVYPDGTTKKAGTLGDIGCTSFFPSKTLGAYGDGGAIFTSNEKLASKLSSIVNHGTKKKYFHEQVGINSRLDTLQAAILKVKLNYLDQELLIRRKVAEAYDVGLQALPFVETPTRAPWSTHVYHQYTLKVTGADRDKLRDFLKEGGIPSMVYYPLPMHRQEAFRSFHFHNDGFPVSDHLCQNVLSLPMHPYLTQEETERIINRIKAFKTT